MPRTQCSFCGKRDREVTHLVVADKAAICSECVELCAEVNRSGLNTTGSILVTGIGELVTNDRYLPGLLGRIEDAAIAITDGFVRWTGPTADIPVKYQLLPALQCGGRAVVPGFIDASAQVIFGGDPADGFVEARQRGAPAAPIEETILATAATSDMRLRDETAERLRRMLLFGTTAADVRVEHASTTTDGARLLDLLATLGDVGAAIVASVGLDGFDLADPEIVEMLLEETLPVCAPKAAFLELRPDAGADDVIHRLAAEGRMLGLTPRLASGSVDADALASLRPISVDNPDPSVAPVLKAEDVIAILTPATTYGLDPCDGRGLWDAGVIVALATGAGPGTAYVENLQLAMAMATVENGLTLDEAVWAATRGGALAIDDDTRGWLGRGSVGDFVVLDSPTINHIAHRPGSNLAWAVGRAGHLHTAR